ncbi:MAG: 1,4-dihydroxy-2-naphthoate polyprenyltransferase [Candidatus Binatia bacterium]
MGSDPISPWWMAARPRTLTASLVPIVVGLSIAPPRGAADVGIAAATVLAALCIQVAVNFANDYFDAAAGIDTAERLGPTRAVQAGLIPAVQMRRAFVGMLAAAVVFGLPLVWRGGAAILVVGLLSMLCAWAYAGGPRPLASLGLGDLFVFVFFGLVPVIGTVWLQRTDTAALGFALLASIPVALLAVAILVVNNLRDIPTDAAAGKLTMAVRLGERGARMQYALFVWIAMAWPLLLVTCFGPGVLLSLAAVPLAHRAVRDVGARAGSALNASLAATARLQLIHGLLLAAGIAAGTTCCEAAIRDGIHAHAGSAARGVILADSLMVTRSGIAAGG